jgi:hypothetical protein
MQPFSTQLLIASCLAGFMGDGSLQLLTKKAKLGGPTGWGLLGYFKLHGSVEALFIAGGMMTIFYIIFLFALRLPPTWYYLAIYGVVLDLLFRVTMLFPTLDGYYRALNYVESAFWGAVPLLIPLWSVQIYRLVISKYAYA